MRVRERNILHISSRLPFCSRQAPQTLLNSRVMGILSLLHSVPSPNQDSLPSPNQDKRLERRALEQLRGRLHHTSKYYNNSLARRVNIQSLDAQAVQEYWNTSSLYPPSLAFGVAPTVNCLMPQTLPYGSQSVSTRVKLNTLVQYCQYCTPLLGGLRLLYCRKFYTEVWLNGGMRGIFVSLGFRKRDDGTVVLDPLAPNTLECTAAVLKAS